MASPYDVESTVLVALRSLAVKGLCCRVGKGLWLPVAPARAMQFARRDYLPLQEAAAIDYLPPALEEAVLRALWAAQTAPWADPDGATGRELIGELYRATGRDSTKQNMNVLLRRLAARGLVSRSPYAARWRAAVTPAEFAAGAAAAVAALRGR